MPTFRLGVIKKYVNYSFIRACFYCLIISFLISSPVLILSDFEDFLYSVVTVWSILTGIYLFIKIILSSLENNTPKDIYINEPHSEAIISVIRQLRNRSKFLKYQSVASLLIIAVTIFLGVTIFMQAGRVSPTANLVRMDRMSDYSRSLQEEKYRIQTALNKIEIIGFDKYISLFLSDLNKITKMVKTGFGNDNSEEKLKELQKIILTDEKGKEKVINFLNSEKNRVEDNLKKIESDITTSTKKDYLAEIQDNLFFLISTTVTRIGVVLLLLFLVRILLGLYRYSLRLAAFYDARADCIQASKDDTANDLILHLGFFSTDSVSFDKISDPPYAHLVELVSIASGQRKSISKDKDELLKEIKV